MEAEVTITKRLVFSAAHIVQTIPDSPCYRLHGHNWEVTVELSGKQQENGMVVDFNDIKKEVMRYDHKVLLPENMIEGKVAMGSFTIAVDKKRYMIPEEDCIILKVPVITAEEIAKAIARFFTYYENIRYCTVSVKETENNEAISYWERDPSSGEVYGIDSE